MIESAESYNDLIREFDKLPKTVIESTYLELCKYPGHRFEDICSRLLCFYFDPTNEHGFHDLFLKSLLQVIPKDSEVSYKNNQIEVINELNSEGKRLDILIKSPDMIIGIENKILASVYNPLDIYSKQVDLYGKINVFKIVLSVKKITKSEERKFIADNNFIIVSYTDFITKIKQNIGNYISQGSQKYLAFIYDFIQTIENMTGNTYDNNELSHFFSSNTEKIENLIDLYNKYQQRVLKIQTDRISELELLIKSRTDNKWWVYDKWDLGYNSFNLNTNKPKIGLESSYEHFNNNPLGRFRIYITTWDIKDFVPYEDALIKLFPNNFLDKTRGNRVFLHMDVIDGDDENLILEKLTEYYNLLLNIAHTDNEVLSISDNN